MEKLNKVTSTAVPLHIENIDTDQIIPARFLKAITKEGFGKNLFRDWRYAADDQPIEDFVLNNDRYRGSVLVAGKNFGCGSSREHAAWALYGHGFRVIISSFFADIFKSNALNNGLLPITVNDEQLDYIFKKIESNADQVFDINLEDQKLKIGDLVIHFDIDSYKKECLIGGLEDIDFLVNSLDDIEAFERQQIIY